MGLASQAVGAGASKISEAIDEAMEDPAMEPPCEQHTSAPRRGHRGGRSKNLLSRVISAVTIMAAFSGSRIDGPRLPTLSNAQGGAECTGWPELADYVPACAATAPTTEPITVTWLWDTAAGRNLMGRKLLNASGLKCVQNTPNRVVFNTAGGNKAGGKSLAFASGSTVGEEVFVMEESPAARAVGIAVQTKKRLFLWDPRGAQLPYMIEPWDLDKCVIEVR